MKKILAVSLVGGALALSSAALATQYGSIQAPTPQPQYFTVRAGGVISLDSRLNNVSNTYVGVGADYTFSRQWFKNGESFLSADWLTNTSHGHSRFNWFPFAINERFFLSGAKSVTTNVGNNAQSYVFVGLGATYFDNIQQWAFSGRGGFGFQFAGNWVAEAVLNLSTQTREPNRLGGDAIGIYVGYKFGG